MTGANLTFGGQSSLNKIQGNDDGSGTSIFDPVLCEIMYRWFCPPTGKILDPFAGGSVRGIVASYLGYNYIGIDLCKKQIEANIEQVDKILKGKNKPTYIIGDALQIKKLAKGEYDF